jgi:hypothetical protein
LKKPWKILKTFSGSSPIFALSIHTTLSQTQAGATVPLSNLFDKIEFGKWFDSWPTFPIQENFVRKVVLWFKTKMAS